MKVLKKIKLINWHGYFNETVEINKNVLITGRTGSGKSTLIDAICFIISGGKIKFNQSARDKGTRTVETYMRGTISNKDCLRPDTNIISHIQLEFFDEYTLKPFLLGCVFELYENDPKASQHFYCIDQQNMENGLFFDENTNSIKNYKQLDKFCTDRKMDIRKFTGKLSEIRNSIGIKLGLENDKYLELLPKAIAFKADYSLDQLIFDFLLPEKNINLDNIRDTIREYRHYVTNIKDSKKKLAILKKVNDNANEYYKCQDIVRKLQVLECQKTIEKRKIEQEKYTREFYRLKTEVESKKKEEEYLEKRIDEIKDILFQMNSDVQMTEYKYLADKIKENEEKLKTIKESIRQYQKNIDNELELAKLLEIKLAYIRFDNGDDFNKFQPKLQEYSKALEQKFDELGIEKNNLNNLKVAVEEDLDELMKKQRALEQGAPVFKPSVTNLIEVISQEIYKKTGVKITPIPFCNLLEIKQGEEEWRNAIEGYLNTKRFDIFVPEEYYDIALNAYEKFKKEKKIYGVGLVNTKKIVDIVPDKNSLAQKLQPSDNRAAKYANYLLGRVICVANENELKNYESAITKTVMVYKNKAARQTKSAVWETPYIGSQSILIQLEQVKAEIKNKNLLRSEYSEQLFQIQAKINLKSKSNCQRLLMNSNHWQEYDDTSLICEKLIDDFNALDTHDLAEKIEKKEDYEKELKECFDSKKSYSKLIEDIQKKQNTAELRSKDIGEKIVEEEQKYANLIKDDSIMIGFDSFAQQYAKVGDIKSEIKSLENKMNNNEKNVLSAMQEYKTLYNFEQMVCIENINGYLQEYNKICSYDLPKYENKAIEVLSQAKNDFQEKYIISIRKNILQERKNIEQLNKVLKLQPFGETEERYKIIVEKSKIKEFAPYYDIFISDENYECKSLLDEGLSAKNKELLDDLFTDLTRDDNSEKEEKMLRKFTDYRNFLSYDIEITDKNGNRFSYNDVVGGKSGGENQNPFYVIIAAAFNQISSYENRGRTKSSACLVFLDEAFDKMDAPRVKSMIEYFNRLQIQVMIAVPDTKAKDIFLSIDTKIVVVKDNNVMKIRAQVKE